MSNLDLLRAAKVREDAGLEHLRQQLTEADDQLAEARTALRQGRASAEAIRRQEEGAIALRREVQRQKIAVAELEAQLRAAESAADDNVLLQTKRENERVKAELETVRREVLRSLVSMAELLRRHDRLVAEKTRLGSRLATLTGEDQAYDNYISCALLHSQAYTGDVQYVVDKIRKARAVS